MAGYNGSAGADGYTGSKGDIGYTGSQGTTGYVGSRGETGLSSSYYPYIANTSTISAAPTAGYVLWSNITQTDSTQLFISHLTSASIDVDIFLGIVSAGDEIVIQAANNSNDYQLWSVTGAVTVYTNDYVVIPVAIEDSGGEGSSGFANDHPIIVAITNRGPIGYTGSAGAGYTGSQGEAGLAGYTGSLGYTGSIGSIGYTGSQGVIGYDGSQGAAGYTGSVGYAGSQGVIGYDGSQGATGYTGSLGYTGSKGDIGYTGSKGDTGSQGVIGYTGSKGDTGSTGYTGSQVQTETYSAYTSSIANTATVTLNAAATNIFYVSGNTVSGNWTANITNSPVSNSTATNITIVINQGSPAYIPTAVNINGTNTVTINWAGGTQPTPNPSKKDVIGFSFLQTASSPANTYVLFGQLITFG